MALVTLGHTVTRGQHFSLPDGPVVSEVNDMLTQGDYPERYRSTGFWDEHITCSHEDGVQLINDPGTDMLGHADLEVLRAIQEEHGGKTAKQLKDESHFLPEYDEPDERGRNPITYTRILHEVGVDRRSASQIVRHCEVKDHLRSLLASVK
jgi:hypothetical protein